MIAFSGLIADGMQAFMAPEGGDTVEQARRYFGTAIWGAPAVLATYSLSGWYSILNIAPPMATAPMEAMPPRCPTMAKSTIAINGVVTLVAMDGHASAMMRRDMEPVLCCV